MMNGFLCIFKALPNFEYQNDGAAINWMKRIMVNECLRSLRKKEPMLLVAEELGQEIPVADNALDHLAAEELFLLITQLPIGYRTVFNLHVIEGMKHGEIAKELGISEGTSKSQLNNSWEHKMMPERRKEHWHDQRKTHEGRKENNFFIPL